MRKIVTSLVRILLRLISVKNIVAASVAYFFEVRIAYGVVNLVYWFITAVFYQNDQPQHWIVSAHWLDWLIGILFWAQIVVSILCQASIEYGTKNPKVKRTLNILLTVLMWPAFAIMAVLFLPMLYIVRLLKWTATKFDMEWLHFPKDAAYAFLTRISVFTLGVRVFVTGKLPKRPNFLKHMFQTMKRPKFLEGIFKNTLKKVDTAVAYVINAGHEGMLDYFIWPLILGFIRSLIVAGTNLLKFPVVGPFIAAKSILVDRNNEKSKVKAMLTAVKAVKSGTVVLLSSYGGRKREEEPEVIRAKEKWEIGPFYIACKAGTFVVPMNVTQSGKYRPALKGVTPPFPRGLRRALCFTCLSFKGTKAFRKKKVRAKRHFKNAAVIFTKQFKWIINVLKNYQWFSDFLDVYVDILPPVSSEGKTPEELMDEVYSVMEKQKLERLAWIAEHAEKETISDMLYQLQYDLFVLLNSLFRGFL